MSLLMDLPMKQRCLLKMQRRFKGVVQLTDAVATDSTKAVTGTAVEGYAVPLNINSLSALP